MENTRRRWIGRRKPRVQMKFTATPETAARFREIADKHNVPLNRVLDFLFALSDRGFAGGLVREVNGKVNAIHLALAPALKNSAYLPKEIIRAMAIADQVAREISVLMVMKPDDQGVMPPARR
jgi:hypothetical protein